MNRFFADTFYWIALPNRRDQWHTRVQEFNRTLGAYYLYTTDEVLSEFLTFCSTGSPHTRRQATLFVRNVLNDSNVTVIPQTATPSYPILRCLSRLRSAVPHLAARRFRRQPRRAGGAAGVVNEQLTEADDDGMAQGCFRGLRFGRAGAKIRFGIPIRPSRSRV